VSEAAAHQYKISNETERKLLILRNSHLTVFHFMVYVEHVKPFKDVVPADAKSCRIKKNLCRLSQTIHEYNKILRIT